MFCRLKTLSFVAATVCFVVIAVLAPVSASAAAENTVWTKYSNAVPPGTSDSTNWGSGRIPLGTTGQGDDYYVDHQDVIKDGSTYKMWYSGHDQSNWRIYYATSPDGLTWTKYDNNIPGASDSICTNGTIALGTAGTGDERGAWSPSVIKDDSTYKMWYGGYDIGATSRIYYATSSNGLTWTKYSNSIPAASDTTGTDGRVPLGTSGSGDEKNTYSPTVIKDGSTYKMWYAGRDAAGSKDRIYYATSTNGLTWTKYTNAVPGNTNTTSTLGRIPLGISGSGDEYSARWPMVIKVGSAYKMWYCGTDTNTVRSRIYYATSPDGLTWTKFNNEIPTNSNTTSTDGRIGRGILSGETGDDNYISAPCVIKEGLYQEGYKYKMWYGGHCGTYWRIYYATCVQPPKEGIIFYSH